MSPIVTVTVMLTLPWIMLGEPPANDHRRYSVVSPSMFTPVKLSMEIPRPVDRIDSRSQEFDDVGTTNPIDNNSNQSEIYKYDHLSMHTELLESKKNSSTDIQYSIHDVINNDLEKIKNQTEENEWTLVFKPKQALISKLTTSDMSEKVLSPPSKFPDNTLESSDKQNKFPGYNHYRIPGVIDYYGTGPIVFNGLQSELVLDDQPAPQPAVQPAPQPPAQPSSPPSVIPEEPIIIIPELPNILNEQIPIPSSQLQMTVMNKINWQKVGPTYFGNTTLESTSTTETISYTSPITNPLDSVKTSSMPRGIIIIAEKYVYLNEYNQ
ncbi:Uncharacterized protein FWK35_00009688 [Aphis craccivora]|uniref:Uncharacterized protein n=1 Tax=Aphis craccivora TaxID=307492 RepID=A0A6G0YZ80_APHCR|nr:Uncharacterized protein FWK35_00009688 [Aphis craccivora]